MSAPSRALRDFAEADLPALIDLWVAAWKATGVPIDFDARRGWIENCLAALRAGGAEIVVGLDAQGKPAGFVTIDPRSGVLDQLCVAPDERGSGLAVALMEEAKRRSPQAIELKVNEANPRAKRFYEREGFEVVGRGVSSLSGLADAQDAVAGERIDRAAFRRAGCHRRRSRLSPWASTGLKKPSREERSTMRTSLILSLTGLGLMALTAPVLAEDITIAVAGPMTGPVASIGEQMKRGAEAAAAAINDAGGVNGRKIKIVIEDDACDPKQAVAVANLIVGQQIKYVDGHACSGSSIPASDVYADNNVLMMSPASSNPVLTEKGHATIMRLYPRDDRQGEFIAPWIAEKYKGKKIAILHDKSAYGKGLAQVVKDKLNAAGVTEVLFEGINPGEKDYTAVITKLKNAGAEFVYFGGYHTEAGLMLRQAADQGYKLNLMTGDSIATSEFWQISGPAGEGTLFTFPTDPRRSPSAAKALEQFKAQGYDPEGFTLFSYGVVQAIAEGIKRAGSDDPKADRRGARGRQAGRDGDGPGPVRQQGRHPRPALRHQHVERRQIRADCEVSRRPRRFSSTPARLELSGSAVSVTNASMSASKASGVSHCGVCPASGNRLHRAAPQRRHGERSEIAAVDQLLVVAVQHGERDLEIAHDRALVAELATLGAGAEIAARPPVRAQNVVEKERRNVGKARSEERGDIGRTPRRCRRSPGK